MKFKQDFFKEEIREGFHIEPMMKCAWAVELEILEDIQKLCIENNIRYFADSGTLLGTIRHKGYIPWDDDIDIAMLRPDYDRFLDVIKRQWKNKYVFHIPGETDNYNMTFAKVYNSNEVSFETEHLLKNHGFPYIAGVDIFPLDIIPDDEGERSAMIQLYTLLIEAASNIKEKAEEIDKLLEGIEELCKTKIDRDGNVEKQLCLLADLVSKSYEGTENTNLMMLCYSNCNHVFKREWYDEVEWKPFETLLLPVPKHYHEILTVCYGDYMIPVQGTATHNYPFYKGQMEIVERKLAERMYGKDALKED